MTQPQGNEKKKEARGQRVAPSPGRGPHRAEAHNICGVSPRRSDCAMHPAHYTNSLYPFQLVLTIPMHIARSSHRGNGRARPVTSNRAHSNLASLADRVLLARRDLQCTGYDFRSIRVPIGVERKHARPFYFGPGSTKSDVKIKGCFPGARATRPDSARQGRGPEPLGGRPFHKRTFGSPLAKAVSAPIRAGGGGAGPEVDSLVK
ncbi:hypothetical protein MRX96_037782 [Rhipicephalus microplus]